MTENIGYEQCPACGNRLDNDDTVCSDCGLTISNEALPKDTIYCPVCGLEYDEPIKICDCGYNFESLKDIVDVAPIWRRFMNFIIDGSICYLFSEQIFLSFRNAIFESITSRFIDSPFLLLMIIMTALMYSMSIVFLYYFLSESLFQKTPGKFLSRTRIPSCLSPRPISSPWASVWGALMRNPLTDVPLVLPRSSRIIRPPWGVMRACWRDIWGSLITT